ncbi:membrane or secreted protein [Bathymodiolus azoricus thioautotrophic gill symbiont]|uniref:Membrane or secreted protein n=1 Tax=Bathymodiolus azoricus thioautotrophic gill symbiont TaxID=235205 RepID=A0A1H6L720_9GAMM|nr:membrane or secreted protein [Bathymodiolus azoricus thioautotrophic gill symbiont]
MLFGLNGSWVCLVLACVLVLVLVLLLGVTCAGLSTDEVFVLDGVITETLDWVS